MKFVSIKKYLLVVLLVLISGAGGYLLGKIQVSISWRYYTPHVSVKSKEPPTGPTNIDFSLFWTVWDRVSQDYYDKKVVDPQRMFYGAISGMVQSLGDPYTVFLSPTQNTETKQELKGEFEGIGAQLGLRDKRIIVIAPLKDTPADRAGVKAGDLILKIDGKDTGGMTLPEAVDRIRGPRGTAVTLTVLHEGKEEAVDLSIVRDTIQVKSVESYVKKASEISGIKNMDGRGEKIGYIRLSQFGDNTDMEWQKAVDTIKGQTQDGQFKGLILDLRNNPGGYLNGAVFVASEFIPQGTVAIQEKGNGDRIIFSVNRKGSLTNVPLLVLINKGSASASEIVSGALRDDKQVKLIGEKSFGKGTVQEAQDLPMGAGLHITTAKWLTPNGTWVNEKGLTPDIALDLDKNDPSHDTQLERAVQELIK